ncbi:hypothetical protein K458DRAFT_410827 [Lentithecium fluviatile CBS 122367]|uniref:Uncharacterized protein n=1 Tax=Lentithecium fluviatile CBS 122367 TaxID=1168545 RepID=A0A6G1ID99_9PLEO|nr:hypothetical protein K458DRAFT_410827 [Lentithecium fluviatile CBS 122367]
MDFTHSSMEYSRTDAYAPTNEWKVPGSSPVPQQQHQHQHQQYDEDVDMTHFEDYNDQGSNHLTDCSINSFSGGQGYNFPNFPLFAPPRTSMNPQNGVEYEYGPQHNAMKLQPDGGYCPPTYVAYPQQVVDQSTVVQRAPATYQFQRPRKPSELSTAVQKLQAQYGVPGDDELVYQSLAAPEPLQALEYPHAQSYLEHRDAAQPPSLPTIKSLPVYDFTFSDPEPICFTAVELITFLPMLCRSKWVVERLINNGLSNTVHLEIHSTHRWTNSYKDGVSLNTVANGYMDAMRGGTLWRAMPKEQQSTWTRKSHKVPNDWKSSVVMNDFVPDRVIYRQNHPKVPVPVTFKVLLQHVKKVPQGDDTADLTRAIDFALGNQKPNGGEWMYPDDLKPILNHIGRTKITANHQDRAVAQRYERKLANKKNGTEGEKEMATRGYKKPSKMRTSQAIEPVIASVIHQQQQRTRTPLPIPQVNDGFTQRLQEQLWQQRSPQGSPVSRNPTHDEGAGRQPSPYQPSPQMQPQQQQIPAMAQTPPRQDRTVPQPRPYITGELIRNTGLSPNIPESDVGVKIMRFTRRPDQIYKDWLWTEQDAEQIKQPLIPGLFGNHRGTIAAAPQGNGSSHGEVFQLNMDAFNNTIYWDSNSPVFDPKLASRGMTKDEWEVLLGCPAPAHIPVQGPYPQLSVQDNQWIDSLHHVNIEHLLASNIPGSSAHLEVTEEQMRGHSASDLLRYCAEADDGADDTG